MPEKFKFFPGEDKITQMSTNNECLCQGNKNRDRGAEVEWQSKDYSGVNWIIYHQSECEGKESKGRGNFDEELQHAVV